MRHLGELRAIHPVQAPLHQQIKDRRGNLRQVFHPGINEARERLQHAGGKHKAAARHFVTEVLGHGDGGYQHAHARIFPPERRA